MDQHDRVTLADEFVFQDCAVNTQSLCQFLRHYVALHVRELGSELGQYRPNPDMD